MQGSSGCRVSASFEPSLLHRVKGVEMVRAVNDRYECAMCAATLDIPSATVVRTMIIGGSGKPNVRVLTVGGEEIHRCVMGDR